MCTLGSHTVLGTLDTLCTSRTSGKNTRSARPVHGGSTARDGAPRGGVARKKVAHHRAHLITKPTMDSRMVARLEVDLAKAACHEQTGGVLNDATGVRVRAQCAGGRLGGWKGGSEGVEAMVRVSPVTSLGKVSNSTFSLVCPKTPKMLKIVEIAMFCSGGVRLLGLRGRILRRRNVSRSASLLRD